MAEIERKWQLNPKVIPWEELGRAEDYKKMEITQQYLELPTKENPREVRVRKIESNSEVKYYKTIKSYDENGGIARENIEQEIEEVEFLGLYNEQQGNIVKKIRYAITIDGVTYEIDIYSSPKELVTVEVEFDSIEEAEQFIPPCWFGKEVTQDSKSKNVNLAQNGLLNEKQIVEIVLTGGPCGGKSTILSELKCSFEEKGFKVLVSKEVATDIMEGGAKPQDVSPYVFQGAVVDSILSNEQRMRSLAEDYRQKGQDVIIFYDRGLADSRAYCDEETWRIILQEKNLTPEAIHSMYNAVFNIETTAYGAEEVYMKQLGNNPTRYETTIESARETEDKTKQAWKGHHNWFNFKNTDSGWIGKQKAIFDETYRLLGMSPVIRRDERYLVDVPTNLEKFSSDNNCTRQEIEQIYLNSNNSSERRIRKIGDDKFAVYYYTEKEGQGRNRIVRERIIDSEEYYNLSAQADASRKPIKKTRFSFTQGQEYYVLDVFPEGEYISLPRGKAIVESKGTTEEQKKSVAPQGFSGVEDITNSTQYTNATLATVESIKQEEEELLL